MSVFAAGFPLENTVTSSQSSKKAVTSALSCMSLRV